VIRRPARVLPAVLTAAVVLAAAAGVAVACVQALLGQTPWLSFEAVAATAAGLQLGSPAVLVGAGVVALVGLLLVGAAALPGTPTVLPVDAGDLPLRVGATRRGVRASLTAVVGGVDGVERAGLRVRLRRITARVGTPFSDTADVAAGVRRAIEQHLDELDLARRPRVRVRAVTSGGRR
jgi:hypothetical protein